MKINFLKGASLFLATTLALSVLSVDTAEATDGNAAMEQMNQQMNQQFLQEQLQNMMNQQNQNQANNNKNNNNKDNAAKKDDSKVKKNELGQILVTAKGYITYVNGDYYMGVESKDPYQIVVKEDSDVEVVTELIADIQVPVTYEGYLDEKTKKIYVHSLVLNKQPSKRLETKINKALDEWEKTRPVSAKGYIIQHDDGNFYFKVGKKYYLIDPKEKDIEIALDLIIKEEIMLVQLTGLLEDIDGEKESETDDSDSKKEVETKEENKSDEDSKTEENSSDKESAEDSKTEDTKVQGSDTEGDSSKEEEKSTVDTSNLSIKPDKIFKVTGLNFLEALEKEFLDNLNEELFKSKDGTEVKVNGYIYSDGEDLIVEFNDMSLKIVHDGLYEEVPLILDLVKDLELKTSVTGTLDIATNTIKTKKIDVIDTPSSDLAKEINEILSEYAEGEALARGNIVSTSSGYGLKIKDKVYDISIGMLDNKQTGKKEEVKNIREFLDIVKDSDVFVQGKGLISTKNLTFEIFSASIIGVPKDDTIRAQLGKLLAPELKIPETGSKITAEGYIVKKGSNYYLSIAFNDFLLKTEDAVISRLLPIIEREELVVGVEGIVDKELKIINSTYLQLLQEPSEKVLEELKLAAEGKEKSEITAGKKEDTSSDEKSSNKNQGVLPYESLLKMMNGGNGSLFTSLLSNNSLSSQSYDQMLSRLSGLLTGGATVTEQKETEKKETSTTNKNTTDVGKGSTLFGNLNTDKDTSFGGSKN